MLIRKMNPLLACAICIIITSIFLYFFIGKEAKLDEHVVEVTAINELWLQSAADGAETKSMILKSGERYRVTFPKKLLLTIGNVGATYITYNGKPYHAGGENNPSVKKFIIQP